MLSKNYICNYILKYCTQRQSFSHVVRLTVIQTGRVLAPACWAERLTYSTSPPLTTYSPGRSFHIHTLTAPSQGTVGPEQCEQPT